MRLHVVTHALNGVHTQPLDGRRRSIAEGIAKEVHRDCDNAKECQEAHSTKRRTKYTCVDVAEYGRKARLAKLDTWKLIQWLEAEATIALKHCVENRDNHCVVEGVEQRMKGGKEEVWYGIST